MPSSAHPDNMQASGIDDWKEALDNYDLALEARSSEKCNILGRLDTYIYTHLPIAVSSRDPHHINFDDYVRIVEWKLRKQKWRPETLRFARMVAEEEVISASMKAFKHLEHGDLGEAFDALLPLKGSSPSIASAILSIRDSSVPFMSYELLRATVGRNISFHRSTFLKIVAAVKAKARYLSTNHKEKTWTSVDVERAVYSRANLPTDALQIRPPVNDRVPHNRDLQNPTSGRDTFPSNPAPLPSTETVHERGIEATEEEGTVRRFARARRRKVRPDGIEVLKGHVDFEDEEQIDLMNQDLKDPPYIPSWKYRRTNAAGEGVIPNDIGGGGQSSGIVQTDATERNTR